MPAFQQECCKPRANKLKLAEAVELARSFERSAQDLKALNNPSGSQFGNSINYTTGNSASSNTGRGSLNSRVGHNGGGRSEASAGHIKCKYCGYTAHKPGNDCPAYGKQCKNCGRNNHFKSVCQGRTVGQSNSSGLQGLVGNQSGSRGVYSNYRGGQQQNQTRPAPPSNNRVNQVAYGHEQCLPNDDDEYFRPSRSKEDEADYAEFKRWRDGKTWIAAIDEPCGIVNEGPRQTVFLQGSLVRHRLAGKRDRPDHI